MKPTRHISKFGAAIAVAAATLLAAGNSANATLLAYEPFDYSTGSLTNLGGTSDFGFSQVWQANSTHASNMLVVAGGYSYSDGSGNTLVTTGNRGHFTGQGGVTGLTGGPGDNTGGNASSSQPFRGLGFSRGASGATESTWISFIALRTGNPDPTPGAPPGDFLYGRGTSLQFFYNSVTSTSGGSEMFAVGRGTQSSETDTSIPNDTWGVLQQGNANAAKASGVNWTASPADFMLVRIDHVGGIGASGGVLTNADTLRLWINPNLNVVPADGAANVTLNANDFNPALGITRDFVFNRLRLFGGSDNATVGYGAIDLDEVRIGDDFSSVTPYTAVPEPAFAAVAGLGILAVILRRRR